MQEKCETFSFKLEQNTNVDAIAEAMEANIEEAAAKQMRTKDRQINATYHQSLTKELKNHEKIILNM